MEEGEPREGYSLLEHTADMGIEIQAESREGLFAQAAYGLLEILSGSLMVAGREERVVALRAGDVEELLVVWLNEILYLFETQRFQPVDFEVEQVKETGLRARVRGEPFDPERHPVQREVKAVTYHQLKVERSDGWWHARVYVDL